MVSPMSTSSMPDHRADVAGLGVRRLFAAQALEQEQIDDLVLFDLAVALQQGDLLVLVDHAVEDAADADAADILAE